ncbi:hypothetical protein L6452_18604 [Arctium lappa]|uniref:Uncharacterized protein n=1 Tax=Arctium lappa TaxID=4217 RepID=A0ACB9C6J3_ARCLA|nr:hypothetical protein L6452_18604 [Arctium lappa]
MRLATLSSLDLEENSEALVAGFDMGGATTSVRRTIWIGSSYLLDARYQWQLLEQNLLVKIHQQRLWKEIQFLLALEWAEGLAMMVLSLIEWGLFGTAIILLKFEVLYLLDIDMRLTTLHDELSSYLCHLFHHGFLEI